MNRRQFLSRTSALAATSLLPAASLQAEPKSNGKESWLSLLGRNLNDEHDYIAQIEGKMPADLRGRLLRNGPGIFERNGVHKGSVLDGDGMIQAFDLGDSKARYRNKFVRTEKFVEEEKLGRFNYATWCTRKPGGWTANIGLPNMKSQAGVTTVVRNGEVMALDEVGFPHRLDYETLETIGSENFETELTNLKAHTKFDPETGEWLMFGDIAGANPKVVFLARGHDGQVTTEWSHDLPRSSYMHDFFVTRKWVVFVLHPAKANLVRFLGGIDSFAESLRWSAKDGNILMICDRAGKLPPSFIESDARYMWHSVNAYELGEEIVAEFVGYDDPDHFIGEDPAYWAIMEGRQMKTNNSGEVRRYRINVASSKLSEEVVYAGNCEFPAINPIQAMTPHSSVFVADARPETIFHHKLTRIDMKSGKSENFDFGSGFQIGEPVFASRQSNGNPNAGYVMTIVLDGTKGRSLLAIFDAERVAEGPLAKVHLTHHTPLSFHGWWQPAEA